MVVFPKKRIFGLIGAPRSGKDTVANYLQETRNFGAMAFADKIKEEFGISKEDFEAAKIAGNIEDLRKKLWDFSATKKNTDPLYFIKRVMDEANLAQRSVVITDIRTLDELKAFFDYGQNGYKRRIYFINNTAYDMSDRDGLILGSKIPLSLIEDLKEQDRVRTILNVDDGLFKFLCELDNFFFKEDIMDLPTAGENDLKWRSLVSDYVSQFDIRAI